MARFFLFLLVFCTLSPIFAQQQEKKISYRADWRYYDEETLPGIDRLIGNVVFTHENTIGYADSAYFYIEDNKMRAFGRPVKFFINDTVTLLGNRAMYDGNSKIATVSRNVILKDNSSILYTDSLIYNTHAGIGFYLTGGKMISKEDTLYSRVGRYNTHNNLAQFNKNVMLKNPTYTMTCDSFNYNTNTEIVYFLCRTHLKSDENDIFTNSGWYDTRLNYSKLIDNVNIFSKQQQLVADTVYYDKNNSFGIVKNNVTIIDTAKNFMVKGNYGEYSENGGWTWITDSALLRVVDKEKNDSLYLHSDTLKLYFDTEQNPKLMLAFFHVKFFRKDLQGACDSMCYHVEDSVGTMYYNPILWSENNQLSGDSIRFSVVDSVSQKLELMTNAFVISNVIDEVEFNQVKGKNIIGLIRDRELKQVDVMGNVEVIYYVLDEDSLLIGINKMETSEMRIFLENNEIEELRFYDYPDGKLWSDNELPMKDRLLKDFRWLDAYRAKQITDIFSNPIPRMKIKQEEEKFLLRED